MNSRGISVVSVLIATAIAGVVVVGVLSVVDQVTRAIARNNASTAIEGAIRTVQGIVANKDLCNNALRLGGAGAKLVLPPPVDANPFPEIVFDRIYAQQASGASADDTLVLRRGGTIFQGYTVTDLRLRERAAQGRGTLVLSGVTYNTYAAEIAITIRGGIGTAVRTIPYNPVVLPGTNTIEFCYQDSSAQYLCEQLGGTYNKATSNCDNALSATNVNCKDQLEGTPLDCPSTIPDNTRCQQIYYVAGFKHTGAQGTAVEPICRCQRTCWGSPTSSGTGAAAGAAASGATAAAAVIDATSGAIGSPVGGVGGAAIGGVGGGAAALGGAVGYGGN